MLSAANSHHAIASHREQGLKTAVETANLFLRPFTLSRQAPDSLYIVTGLAVAVRFVEGTASVACHNLAPPGDASFTDLELKPPINGFALFARVSGLGVLQKLSKQVVLFVSNFSCQLLQERRANRLPVTLVSCKRRQRLVGGITWRRSGGRLELSQNTPALLLICGRPKAVNDQAVVEKHEIRVVQHRGNLTFVEPAQIEFA